MEHVPVLVDEVLSIVSRPGQQIVVDATIGGGGHAEAILNAFEGVSLIGIDRDLTAVRRSKERLKNFEERASLSNAAFENMDEVLDSKGVDLVDVILMDLGVSSFHLDDPERGFSFQRSGPLDMRMDRSGELTADNIVNSYSERELALIFKKYGEERLARRIARAIAAQREKSRIETTGRLARIIEDSVPAKVRRGRIHPATRVFQAIRIAVNNEIENLATAIDRAVSRLKAGGRIIVISFHSLEDRIVKTTLRDLTRRCVCPKDLPVCVCGTPGKVELLTRKPVSPGATEILNNPRSRSARLRAARRLET
ncbi:16S rRNA (cytosine(1402)-N(4))-methyltransferase [hydrothermal vent metagenome]|uniref:16S rRNA (Cytosine(1402)-N(4))-methyltransferase n=1 Tax=hydrothermal vent metagenome TaxID=652676 RepID=A0A3B1CKF9_9ZZZZ